MMLGFYGLAGGEPLIYLLRLYYSPDVIHCQVYCKESVWNAVLLKKEAV